jgi:small nuclear ribonucleoprotein (snRNP)-like protein
MRARWIDRLTHSTVVVHMTNGASVRGVLVAVHKDCLVLAHAAYLGGQGAVSPIDGEAVIPRESVVWMQAAMKEASP